MKWLKGIKPPSHYLTEEGETWLYVLGCIAAGLLSLG